jgi:hypothetical protein
MTYDAGSSITCAVCHQPYRPTPAYREKVKIALVDRGKLALVDRVCLRLCGLRQMLGHLLQRGLAAWPFTLTMKGRDH